LTKKTKEAKAKEIEELEELSDQQIIVINNISPDPGLKENYRTIVACGDIEEESAAQIIHSLLYYSHRPPPTSIPTEPEPQESVEFVISTCGGSAIEMFGIYDVMRHIRESTELVTYGVGKVMSAGVLLLAAGTKGKRKIGRNCRVMIHGVMGGYHGSLSNMENEIAEVKWIQERYIENLVNESFLSEKKVKTMLKKHVDVYLSADDAVKYGIADIVI
jgi:ATP-dependent Clp protease protease subunit